MFKPLLPGNCLDIKKKTKKMRKLQRFCDETIRTDTEIPDSLHERFIVRKSDQKLFFPYNINTCSSRQVIRITENH